MSQLLNGKSIAPEVLDFLHLLIRRKKDEDKLWQASPFSSHRFVPLPVSKMKISLFISVLMVACAAILAVPTRFGRALEIGARGRSQVRRPAVAHSGNQAQTNPESVGQVRRPVVSGNVAQSKPGVERDTIEKLKLDIDILQIQVEQMRMQKKLQEKNETQDRANI